MNTITRLTITLKAIRQLGWHKTMLFAWYKFKIFSGLIRLQTPIRPLVPIKSPLVCDWIPLPDRNTLANCLGEAQSTIFTEAKEIINGQARLFGAETRPLQVLFDTPQHHWVAYTSGRLDGEDIKFTWEAGRFGWALILARAYHLSGDNKYAQIFWKYTEAFLNTNPPNSGPHWASAQEVALRLICMLLAYRIFERADTSTPERQQQLAAAIAAHALRILPTLAYGRAQNNNHLLSEAIGLCTAARALPDHPQAQYWHKLGWELYNQGLQSQISTDGSYIQNSTNYHRLMLQLALWGELLTSGQELRLPRETRSRLVKAVRWLYSLVDKETGQVPNLGPNDGAYILPLTVCPFQDYRPVLQVAGRAFLKKVFFPSGPWDEMGLWLSIETPKTIPSPIETQLPPRITSNNSWAYFRVAKFQDRPGHADQLHLDLWWRGLNIAQDAGTYLYNSPPPWDNVLAGTDVHNTVTVNAQPQMRRAGRFLWLDWAQAETLDIGYDEEGQITWMVAEHYGYRHFGVIHRRTVSAEGGIWIIRDQINPSDGKVERPVSIRIHWLLPDYTYGLSSTTIRLETPHGPVTLEINLGERETTPFNVQLIRAGCLVAGKEPAQPHAGWISPTYGHKQAALSFAITLQAVPPYTLTSRFTLPE
jgi:hypothetical protein